MEKTITLTFGYPGASGGETHRAVRIGRRLTGADLMRFGDEPDSHKATMFSLLTLQAAITAFGSLPMPVPMTALLSLKSVDRQDLGRAYSDFLRDTAEGRRSERLGDDLLRLAFGFRIDGQVYDVVRVGRLLTGYDELEGDELSGWRQECFLYGKQITQLSQSGGAATLPGPVALAHFETLDADDVFAIQRLLPDWYDSFRRRGGEVQADGGGRGDLSGEALRVVGGANSEPAA